MSLPTVDAPTRLPATAAELRQRLAPLGVDVDLLQTLQVVVAEGSGALLLEVTTRAVDPLGQPFLLLDEHGEGRLATETRLLPLAALAA